MSDAQPAGLLLRAKRLTSLARQAREGAEAVQDHTRAETALSKLGASLSELESAVALQSKLVRCGVTSTIELDLTKAPKDLQRHLGAVGRPSPQLLTARAVEAAKAVRTIAESTADAWRTWSLSRLDELPVDRLARLGFDRQTVESRLERLRRIAGAPPTVDAVESFLETYESVASRLEKVTPEGPLDALLAKLPCHLDELTNDELRMLREDHPDIGAQVVLRVE